MDILNEKRSFTTEDGSVYYIKDPNTDNIKNADWMYSKVYTKSLMDGISTSSEMLDILTKRGIIGPEYEKRAEELTEVLQQAIIALEDTDDTDDKYIKAMRVAEARDDLFRWNQRFSGPMAHTCEQLADDARLEYLTATMIYNSQNKRVWDSYDAYVADPNHTLIRQARVEVMLYFQGVDSDFMNQTPEAQAIREVEHTLAEQIEKEAEVEAAIIKEQEELASVDTTEDTVPDKTENNDKNDKKVTKKKGTSKKPTTKKSGTKKVKKSDDE